MITASLATICLYAESTTVSLTILLPVLLLFSHKVVADCLWPHGLQHTRLPGLHDLPEFAQTHVHWVGDAIQPSHPLSPTSPPALNLSQGQGLLQWVDSLHQVAKVLYSCYSLRYILYLHDLLIL